MKRKALLVLITILSICSCEQDDICVETLTPKLIIKFYDVNDTINTKEAPTLNIWVDGRDTIISNQTTDSIAIPLDVNDMQTIYNFRSESIIDQLTVTYDLNQVYVSRSCGFIANYENVATTNTDLWIDEVLVISTTIENEDSTHVQIRH